MTDNITPAAAPEPTPPPAATPYAATPPAATPYAAPAGFPAPTKRPGTVTAGIVIIAIQAVLSVIVALLLFAALGAAGSNVDPDAVGQTQLLAVLVLVSGIINGIAIIFVARGYGLARFVIVVAGGIVVLLDLISLKPAPGDFLWILAIVLLFLPASNAWFTAKAAQRSGVTA